MREFSFEKLEVWKLVQDLIEMVYSDTTHYPKTERYGIVSQIRRSAISVSSNIAEGSGKKSDKDKKRFLSIAYGSLMETMNLIVLSRKLKYISYEKELNYRRLISRISAMLTKLSEYFNRLTV